MFGSWDVQILAVAPVSIHGDAYFDLHIVRVDVDADVGLDVDTEADATQGNAPDAISIENSAKSADAQAGRPADGPVPGDAPQAVVRVPGHLFAETPAAGGLVNLTFLLGQVTAVA